ncbi:hypothetical protein HUW46_02340 [Amycolatopsis sp. CA-230715]|nr:hypothetical protein HUW46_02340 [Amycolatopsis sp. CA-230715]
MHDTAQQQLAHRMSELALSLQDETDHPTTLNAIVDAVVDMVPAVTWAGISLVRGKAITSEAPSDPVVAELDELQTELGEGPCLTSIRAHHTVRIPDFGKPDQPWPRYAARAYELGARSLLARRLFVRREQLGALNLYSDETEAFTPDAEVLIDLFAQHAAVALAGATHEHHLNEALANRDILGQAKGILMQRDRLTGQRAFQLLVRASQDSNMKVVDVARWLVEETEKRAARQS